MSATPEAPLHATGIKDEFERRDVFNRAADLLLSENWITGSMHNNIGYCMVGALRQVRFGTPDISAWKHEEGYVEGFHSEWSGIHEDVMIDWNDGVAGDINEVVERLREMASGKHFDNPEAWRNDD